MGQGDSKSLLVNQLSQSSKLLIQLETLSRGNMADGNHILLWSPSLSRPTLMCMHLKYAPYPQMSAFTVTKKGPGKDGDYCIHFQVTPLTALKFAELTVKAGFPKGVINIIPGSGKPAGQTLF